MKASSFILIFICALFTLSSCKTKSGEESTEATDKRDDTNSASDQELGTDSDETHPSESDDTEETDATTDTGDYFDTNKMSGFDVTQSGIGELDGCIVALNGTCLKEMTRTQSEVCGKWAPLSHPTDFDNVWTAGEEMCDPGVLSDAALEDALARLNFYRWLANLQPLEPDPDSDIWNQVVQCASVTAHNESDHPHDPDETFTCYSEDAAAAAATSSIDYSAYSPTVGIDRFIFDTGDFNFGRLGHRRSLLSYFFDQVAIGFTRANIDSKDMLGATCLRMNLESYRESDVLLERISAYPPPGIMPHELTLQKLKVVFSGLPLQWHLNIQNVDFHRSTVQLYRATDEGLIPLQVETGVLEEREMDGEGIWIQPPIELPAGEYLVDIGNTEEGAIGYRVILTDCGTAVPDSCDLVAQNCDADWLGCYQTSDSTGQCSYAGFLELGSPCSASIWCRPGLVCIHNMDKTETVCSAYCDDNSSDSDLSCDTFCPGPLTYVENVPACTFEL